ncbi:Uncharacterised protein [uncultured archaeon]|nr:Uncharacterised protein [uncultured archaeon]
MNPPYDFLQPLGRLMEAYHKFERTIWLLNAAIISIAAYILIELIGIPAFMHFYWQDSLIISHLPIIFSAIIGFACASFLKKRKTMDLFPLLGSELSEKARTAYDNQDTENLPMERLAQELKVSLSAIKPAQILNQRQIRTRATVAVLLLIITIFIAQSQISMDITPTDFQSISDLKDRALGAFEKEKTTQSSSSNLTGNLFGNPSLAVLSENKLDLELYPGTGTGSLARNTEPVQRAFQPSPTGEASAVSSELYIESLPPENREIIKNYFTALSMSNF